jgi:hypothetical protein
MKNIHVLPTDKPSRLVGNDVNQLCYQSNKSYKNDRKWMHRKKFNIYITSDEDIMIGNFYIAGVDIYKCLSSIELEDLSIDSYCKKIILTTDQELIKDGVQAIDDEFLNWFIKNPNCESVRIGKDYSYGNLEHFDYKIIITKEEPKQEKLEQIAEEFAIDFAEWAIQWRVEFVDDAQEGVLYTYGGLYQKFTMKQLLEIYKKQ